MRITATVLFVWLIQGCGWIPAQPMTLSEEGGAPTQAACFDQDDARLCIPHVNRGERLFALVERGDDAAAQRFASRLTAAMGRNGASLKRIADGFTKAEEEARTLYPDRDLYDVSAFFPEAVRAHLNRFKNFSGPNCFATSLMASGLLKEDELLYVGLEELQLYFERFFAEVSEPRFGDVVHYDVQGTKDHAAYYLFDDLVFHKKGYRKGYGYRMTQMTKVFAADPFEWRPSPFDDFQPKDDPSFGEKPKRYYRLRTPDTIPSSPAPTAKEAAAMAVVDHIYQQTKHSAPQWSVHEDMGTMMESALTGLLNEFTFLKTSSSFDARLAYERVRSLESQIFQSIEERLYTSARADEGEINEKYCFTENDFLKGLLAKFHSYRHQTPPSDAVVAKMTADVRSLDRKTCRFTWRADW